MKDLFLYLLIPAFLSFGPCFVSLTLRIYDLDCSRACQKLVTGENIERAQMVLEILRQHPFRTKILRNAPRFILCSPEVIENKRLSLAFISRLSTLRDNSFLFGLYSVTRLAFQHHHVQSIFLCCI